MDKKQVFMVQVSCMTFNQAPYIIDTLNGFCIQQTSFPFICTIFDDCSTDGEQEVIRQYLQEHFDWDDKTVVRNDETEDYVLTYARHKTNHNCFFAVYYLKYNHYSIGKNDRKNDYCKEFTDNVPYIALCEGDDYWIDPNKLQKQVDYLESHPKCGLVWAKAKCYIQESDMFRGTTGHYMSGYYDMFINYSIAPLTSIYRKTAIEGFHEFVKGQKWLLGDSPLFLYIAHDNDIHFFDEIVGVYRVLRNSASHHTSYEKNIAFQKSTFDVVKFFCEKYGHPDFKRLEDIHYSRLFNYAFNYEQYNEAKQIYMQIAHPDIKIRFKRLVMTNRVLRSIYQYIYHKLIKK